MLWGHTAESHNRKWRQAGKSSKEVTFKLRSEGLNRAWRGREISVPEEVLGGVESMSFF